MTTKIHDYQKGLSACAGLIKDMHNRWFTIAMDVLRRAGSLAKDALGEVNRVPFESDLDHSLDQLENCAEYITKVAEVAMAIASKETPANFESNVIDLAKLTSRWPTEPIKWFAESSATDPVVLSQLSEKMQIFTDTIGDAGCQSSACNADGPHWLARPFVYWGPSGIQGAVQGARVLCRPGHMEGNYSIWPSPRAGGFEGLGSRMEGEYRK
eukprot:4513668-Pyramimonas_sp.AAC.1